MATYGTSLGLSEIYDLKEEFLFCKVCTGQYTMQERRPKELPCGHTYCMSCIATVNPRHCPTCRQVFDLTDDDAVSLQDNLTIKKLMSFFKAPVSERTDDGTATCEECSRGLKTASWCYHCRRQICKRCEECHSTMMSFAGHLVEPLNSIDLSEAKKTYYCELHKTEKSQKYCKNCEAVMCCVCTVANHQHHKVVDLDSVKEEIHTKLNKLVEDIVSIQESAILKSCRANRKSDMLDKNYQECIDDMDLFFTNLQSQLNDTIAHHKKTLKAEVDAFKLSSIDQYKKETEEAEIFLSHIGSTFETIQPILDRQCPVEESHTFHTHRSSLQELLDRSKSLTGTETEPGPKLAYSLLSFTHPVCDRFTTCIVNNTSIQAYNIVPAHTEVICKYGFVGTLCRFFISLRDRKNQPSSHHSKHIKIEAYVCLKTDSTSRFDCKVQRIENKRGEHAASFVPPVVGTYNVLVKVMGESVPSPSIVVYRVDVNYTIACNTLSTSVAVLDENKQMVFEKSGIAVECIDPVNQYIKPEEKHYKNALYSKFYLKHFGKHVIRVVSHDIFVEGRSVVVKHLVMKSGHGFEIVDLAVLPSNNLMFLTTSAESLRRLSSQIHDFQSSICYVGLSASTTRLAIGYFNTNDLLKFAVSSTDHKGCVCSSSLSRTITSLTFFTQHSLSILKEHTVDLKEHIIPEAIAMTSTGNILVCTSSNIKVFLSDGSLQKTLTQDQIKKPSNMSVDFKDNVFICDSASHCVHMLNSDFEFVKTFESGITNPLSIAVSNSEHLIVLEKHNILVVNIEDGQLIGKITLPCELSGSNNKIVCSKDEHIYVSNASFVIKMHLKLSLNTDEK